MNTKTYQNRMSGFALVFVLAVLLLGGIGITGAAAQSSIPGDALYPVKTTIEQTRLSLAQDAGDRAQMKLAYAEQRLVEISALIDEGRYREIPAAVLAFESHINAAIRELKTVSEADPARAGQLAQEVTSALTRYAQTLTALAAVTPDSVKSEVTRALDTTEIANALKLPTDDDHSNANDNGDDLIDDNGNDNAALDDNSNGSSDDSNDNAAIDDNSNGGSDDNGNDNTALDDNSNDSSDDSNDNAVLDDNSTDSSDDNGNDNAALDDNSNGGSDDNGNDNAALDDNSNGGSDDNGNNNATLDDNSTDSSDDNSNNNTAIDDNSNGGSDDNTTSDDNSNGGSDDSGNNDNGSDDNSGKDDSQDN